MLQNVFQLKADLKKKSTFVATPEIVQNDNVRFEIEVTDNGKPLALDNVQTVSLAHSTKGEAVVTSGEIEGNKVIFNLGTLETKYVGQVNATVQLYDAEGRISTIKFPYYVVADPTGKDYVPSEKEQTLIEVVMAEAQAKIDELSQVDVVDLKAKQDEFTVQLAQTESEIKKMKAPKIDEMEIIAHRGFAGLAPENTISAYSLATSLGVKSLECDVQVSSDGVPVVIHDSTVDRTTNGTGNVKEMTLSQLKELDAGTKFSPFYAGTKIPTFDEFLKYAKGRAIKVYPEIKDIRSLSDIKLIIDVIKNNGMENVTVVQSFNLDHLLEVRKYSSKVKIALLIYDTELSQYTLDILENDGNAMILYGYSYVITNPSVITQLHDLGIDLGVWTVPNRDVSDWLLNIGVTKQMFDVYVGGVV